MKNPLTQPLFEITIADDNWMIFFIPDPDRIFWDDYPIARWVDMAKPKKEARWRTAKNGKKYRYYVEVKMAPRKAYIVKSNTRYTCGLKKAVAGLLEGKWYTPSSGFKETVVARRQTWMATECGRFIKNWLHQFFDALEASENAESVAA